MNQDKIGNFIKSIRLDNNLTQKEFANKFGVTYQAVSKWENGKNIPDISIIKSICEEYNLSIDEFLGTSSNNKKRTNFLPYILLFIFLALGIFTIIHLNKNNFEFKMISANCKDFEVTGSMAFNNDKTSIYISEINYCGKEIEKKYDNINCVLYEDNGNTKKVVEKCEIGTNETLESYLKNVRFHIDNYNSVCKKNNENSYFLEIEAKRADEDVKMYKIPLRVSNDCD